VAIKKESKSLGMPWEKEYGYSQAVRFVEVNNLN
jgi:hypothetical protein